MTTRTRTRRVSAPAYYLGRPAALWLAALARARRGYGAREAGVTMSPTASTSSVIS